MSGTTEAATLSPTDRDRLAKMLALLDSPFDGERLAAVASATKLLERRGVRWCQILDHMCQPPPRPPQRQPRPVHWRLTCLRLLERVHDLKPWEANFVRDIVRGNTLTTRQHSCLREMERRVAGSAAA
jgi:hypothetical protein